jgi:hypothetical protein
MTTSATTIYELSRDNLIKAALRKIGALAAGGTPTAEDLTNGQTALNSLIALFQGLGLTIWKRRETDITLVASQRDYTIGIGQTINQAFPLRIESAVLLTTATGNRQDMDILSLTEFSLLNSSTTGNPVNITYTPKVNLGVLSVWPKPDATIAAAATIHLIYRTAFEGFTSAAETPDFPQEWQLPLIYGAAVLLAPEYGVPLNDRNQLVKEYTMYLDMAVGATQGEDESIFFQVDNNGV